MYYHREFTCKRDETLADPRRKISCSLGFKNLSWKFLLQIIFILPQLHFHANKVKFNAFLKNSYILDPWILLRKIPYRMLFSAGSSQLLHMMISANNFCLTQDKISLKFCECFRFFLAVFMEKIQKLHYLSYVRKRIVLNGVLHHGYIYYKHGYFCWAGI